jgi:hypothetical protein
MPRCLDCAHLKDNACQVMKRGLSFDPSSEVVCRDFKPK